MPKSNNQQSLEEKYGGMNGILSAIDELFGGMDGVISGIGEINVPELRNGLHDLSLMIDRMVKNLDDLEKDAADTLEQSHEIQNGIGLHL